MSAVDAHLHILDPRFPSRDGRRVPAGMTVSDYHRAAETYGTQRAVIVQSKTQGTDPSCLLDALAQLGNAGRGIAVLTPDASDATLTELDAAGVRGLRFSLWKPQDAVAGFDMIAPLAERLAELGWHAQLHMHADQIAAQAEVLRALPCPMVFDHMGRLPPGPNAAKHPAFPLIADLAREGRAWVKLSGPYLNQRAAVAASMQEADWRAIGRAWVDAIPDRLIWGSDWPHVTEQPDPPTADHIADTLFHWCDGDADLMTRIRITTPADLYGFG